MNTRQLIIDAAWKVLLTHGLVGATTKEIAKAAGYAEATIYKHFTSKQELFMAVLQTSLPNFVTTMQEIIAQPTEQSLQANLEAIARASLDYYEKIVPLGAAFLSDPELLEEQRKWMKETQRGPHRFPERLAAYIKLEQSNGRVRPDADPLLTAAALLGSCFQYVFLRQFIGENPLPLPEQDFVSGLVHTLILGLTPQQ